MIASGTIVNTLAVLIGGGLGLAAKKGLSESLQDSMMKVMGIAVIFVGASGALSGMLYIDGSGALKTQGTLLMILSLTLGTLAGELLKIEDRMEMLGVRLKNLFKMQGSSRFVEGFVTNALVICIGAMAVVGSLQDGLANDPSMLYTKALLDGIISLVFAASLGIGVLFAALPLFIYQGGITLLAGGVAAYLNETVIGNLSYIGSILITVTGINLLFGKKVKVGNMLPALIAVLILGIWL